MSVPVLGTKRKDVEEWVPSFWLLEHGHLCKDAAVILGCVSHRRDLMFYIIGGITVSVVAFFFTIKFLFELAARIVSFLQHEDRERRGERTIYDYVRGNYLDPRSCKISWDWKDPYEVGHSMAFRVHNPLKSQRRPRFVLTAASFTGK